MILNIDKLNTKFNLVILFSSGKTTYTSLLLKPFNYVFFWFFFNVVNFYCGIQHSAKMKLKKVPSKFNSNIKQGDSYI